MSADDIRDCSVKAWMPNSTPKVCDWLQPSLTPEQREQMKAMGNIVMPQLANCAAHLLADR